MASAVTCARDALLVTNLGIRLQVEPNFEVSGTRLLLFAFVPTRCRTAAAGIEYRLSIVPPPRIPSSCIEAWLMAVSREQAPAASTGKPTKNGTYLAVVQDGKLQVVPAFALDHELQALEACRLPRRDDVQAACDAVADSHWLHPHPHVYPLDHELQALEARKSRHPARR